MSRFDDIAYRQAEREYLSPPEIDPEVEQIFSRLDELEDIISRVEDERSVLQDRLDELTF